jgi:hypothetical protein
MFTSDYCHGCKRVLWTQAVLKHEAEHKSAHENGECACGTIFRYEERNKNEAETEAETRDDERRSYSQGYSQPVSSNRGMWKGKAAEYSQLPRSDVRGARQGDSSGNKYGQSYAQNEATYPEYYVPNEQTSYGQMQWQMQVPRQDGYADGGAAHMGFQSTKWYPHEDQYRGVPARNMIIGHAGQAGPVSPGIPVKKPGRPYGGNFNVSNVTAGFGGMPRTGTMISNEGMVTIPTGPRSRRVPGEVTMKTNPSTPMVISSAMYEAERASSAPPPQH